MRLRSATLLFPTCAVLAACATAGGGPTDLRPTPHVVVAGATLPAIDTVDGVLAIDVVYPPDSSAVTSRDSTFIFGSTGSGRAALTVNGSPVTVAPNGAFLAFLPVPADGVYRIHATKAGQTASLEHHVLVPPLPAVPDTGATILRATIEPRGAIALPAGEPVEVRFLGTAGGRATIKVPDGPEISLVERPLRAGAGGNAADFQREPGFLTAGSRAVSEYVGTVPAGQWLAADTTVRKPVLQFAERYPASVAARTPVLTLAVGGDTARAPLAVNLASIGAEPLAAPRAAVARAPANAPPDWTLRGRPGRAGPLHWFWPDGTRLALDGEWNGMYRVRLSRDLAAWVPAADVEVQPEGAPLPRGDVSGVRLIPADGWVDVRVMASARLPHQIDVDGRTLRVTVFGATSAVNFMQYGALDPLVRSAAWSQPADGVFTVAIELAQPVWGYRAFFDEADALVVRIRRPPVIDPARPLAGLRIAVDPGHPPGGATGPTRLTEAEANLAVGLRLRPMLEAAGAQVLMLRSDPAPVDLAARPRLATDMDADLLVSLHNNAFPDGVNPFVNNGTSAYYYQPQSLDLTREVQRALLEELGLRDIGIGRADLALVRVTWMPAVLSETMFLMVPEQENALRNADVQDRIARAHVRALERFLAGR